MPKIPTKVPNKRTNLISVKAAFTPEKYKLLEEYAKQRDISPATAVRILVMEGLPR